MDESRTIRSPFFYVGDKYKLMPQLKRMMPEDIGQYIEPFVGGGSSFLNSKGFKYVLNDIDPYVVELHRQIGAYAWKQEELFGKLFEIMDHYKLSCSYRNICVPDELKKIYVKTYYSKYNKEAYIRMRRDFNAGKDDFLRLYLLLIYGFNHMIRFNGRGEFNLPVGNVDFNHNVYQALVDYLEFVRGHKLEFYSMDYISFLETITFEEDSYIFLDPPYQSGAEGTVLQTLAGTTLLKEDTLIVVEADIHTDFSYVSALGFEIAREKIYKTNKHVFLQFGKNNAD